ncbi:MAG: [Lachnospiraceae bacterium]|nr:[FeFe] hydrogenase H-cluster maturation GTPase HydF [Lachnospiraceae bacterium]
AMEIHPLGACVFMDTAGFDDETSLGQARIEKTKQAAEKTDIAILMISQAGVKAGEDLEEEKQWISFFKSKDIPVLVLLNENDEASDSTEVLKIEQELKSSVVSICAKNTDDMNSVKEHLARLIPENFTEQYITGNLVTKEDVVLLVMPQDIQAPKGRLILPQVQTIRELLDKKCIVMSVTTDEMENGLKALCKPPKLIITDSQVFDFVYEHKPTESMLTSFSVLFAAYKGDIAYYMEGAKAIDSLTEGSRVLIAECCTHAPLSEDIGRVKIPRLLRKRFGEGLRIDMVSGTDYPQDLSGYDLIIQCGACMFNRKYVLSRIERAKLQQIPMTNYGITIAHLTGILEKIVVDDIKG